jgi:tetratricopeptide (TPR) repeat protein
MVLPLNEKMPTARAARRRRRARRLPTGEKALVAYRNGLALKPDETWGYIKLGLCLAELRRFDEAASAFHTLRTLDPKSTVAAMGLGTMAMIGGRQDEAHGYFVETLEFDPQSVSARQSLAILYEKMAANNAEALRLCREIRQIAPDTPGNDECIRRNGDRLAGNADGLP